LSCPAQVDVKKDVHMDKVADIRPTTELSPETIKTICDAISQEFYSWELKEDYAEMS
jgi:hypothetical protein